MDKNAIKRFAIWARDELIRRVSTRAEIYGITREEIVDEQAESVHGRPLSETEKRQRAALISKIRAESYERVMEAAAYTWFNRFIALRFMEVNNVLPSHIRVFTDDKDSFHPQLLTEAIHLELDGLDRNRVIEWKQRNDNDTLYKYLLITQCNALNRVLPFMFQKIDDYTELLFPDNILREGSVIDRMIQDIQTEDWTDQVQITGWLYQYYNTTLKDTVFAGLKKNIKISKENIPAATQLFTPDWIVRYMVENSLGRLWMEGHPDEELKSNWKYYREEAEQEPAVQARLAEMRGEYARLTPADIKVIDPCSGSGHICVYMFDVLMQIYERAGYNPRQAVRSILENNLYGLDIDERAAQLTYFAVMMKACQYDGRFLTRTGAVPQPHVYAVCESSSISSQAVEYFVNGDPALKAAMDSILTEMRDAKEYGSILKVTPVDFGALHTRFRQVFDDISIYREQVLRDLLPLVRAAEALAQTYDVVCTNPPYMGLKNMSPKLFQYVVQNYPAAKNDLYGVFMQCALERLTKERGLTAMITQHVWMFTSGFEKHREALFSHHTLSLLVHLGTRAFEDISGEVVQTCAFVMREKHIPSFLSKYVRLVSSPDAQQKELDYLSGKNQYTQKAEMFRHIPGHPVGYWLSGKIFDIYRNCPVVGSVSSTRQGLKSSDDKRFIRLIHEVDQSKIAHNISSIEQAARSGKKWFWLNKGGQDKWYGNYIYLINWEHDGKEIKEYAAQVAGSYSKNITAIDAYFQECLSWPQISVSRPAFRYIPSGFIFASAGPSLFADKPEQRWYFLGLLNSCVTQELLDAINPTINFGVSDILKLPFQYSEEKAPVVSIKAHECVNISKTDWDSFETSWNFARHPLVRSTSTIAEAYTAWESECAGRFARLKANEEELNRIFTGIYGLQDELSPEVEDRDVTVHRADLGRDIRSLISYAVGCMFGRYSLDTEGLAYAGGEWDGGKYRTFPPDKDNIIPICDDEYFDDDAAGRFVRWVETVYGKATLEENLRFIAIALGGKGSPREVIRGYFRNDFYACHCKIYQKRPIYWLFDSGRKGGFQALVYMHRYQPDTLARMRTDYVHEQQARYRTAIEDLERRVMRASTAERVRLNRRLAKLKDQEAELQLYEEKLHHLADQMIAIDLDDGVKANYARFQAVLAKIK